LANLKVHDGIELFGALPIPQAIRQELIDAGWEVTSLSDLESPLVEGKELGPHRWKKITKMKQDMTKTAAWLRKSIPDSPESNETRKDSDAPLQAAFPNSHFWSSPAYVVLRSYVPV
jgi:hypothetical protein